VLTNEQLASIYPDWSAAKIAAKTGIRERRIAAAGDCASDLAVRAAQKLFDSGAVEASDIDLLLLCTQTPDYFLPTTACMVQDRLGKPCAVPFGDRRRQRRRQRRRPGQSRRG
jgi:3-oxoacyl-[acyl-carrier-protein] synthase-3